MTPAASYEHILVALGRGATVVTATNRQARHLRWRYNTLQDRDGQAVWPTPQVLPWPAWLASLWTESVYRGGAAGALALLNEQQEALLWQSAVNAELPEVAAVAGSNLRRQAQAAFQVAAHWQIELDRVRERAATVDQERFASMAGRVVDQCRQQKWLDGAGLAAALLPDIQSGAVQVPKEICFYGFAPATPLQRLLFAAVDKAGDTVICVEHDIMPLTGTVTEYPDQRGEIDAAARWAFDQLEHQGADVVAILAPDVEQYGEAIKRTCLDYLLPDWRAGYSGVLPVNLADGGPLGSRACVHIALLLLDAVADTCDYRTLGRLLRTPYLAGSEAERNARAQLDLVIRDKCRRDVVLSDVEARARHTAPGFAAILGKLREARQSFHQSRRPGEWLRAIDSLLTGCGWPGERTLDSDEYQAVIAFRELLEAFGSCDALIVSIDFPGAVSQLKSFARERRFAPQGRMDGVQIMSPAEAVGHSFDAMRMIGMTADTWPPTPRPSPLLPLALQRAAGIPEARAASYREQSQRVLSLAGASAPSPVYSWASMRDEQILLPSPAIEALEQAPAVGVVAQSHRAAIHGCTLLETVAHDPAPPMAPGEHQRGGAGVIKAQAACPARAFFQYRLKAEQLPVPAAGIDAMTRGNFVHHVLEQVYDGISGQAALLALSDAEIDARIDAAIGAELAPLHQSPGAVIQTLARNEAARLRSLVHGVLELDRQREPFDIEAREKKVEPHFGPLEFRFFIDRIDRVADGRRLMIDYKSGKSFSVNRWTDVRLGEPQLPLYAAVSREVGGIAAIFAGANAPVVTGIGEQTFGLPKLATDISKKTAGDAGDWGALLGLWRLRLGWLVKEIAGGDVRINRYRPADAKGEYAMLSRIYDASIVLDEEENDDD